LVNTFGFHGTFSDWSGQLLKWGLHGTQSAGASEGGGGKEENNEGARRSSSRAMREQIGEAVLRMKRMRQTARDARGSREGSRQCSPSDVLVT